MTGLVTDAQKKKNAAAPASIPPMPTRPTPLRLFEAHEVHPDLEIDWTLPEDRNDWNEEWRRRELRNEMIKDHLLQGKSVQYKSGGNSLYPKVWSGDTCMYVPVKLGTPIIAGDIVFCQVQPYNRFFAHMVLRIDTPADPAEKPKYWIGNIEGRENGWCYREHIYGWLIEVVH